MISSEPYDIIGNSSPVNRERLSRLSNYSTNLQAGGEISINSIDNTKFDLYAGYGYIIDSYTDSFNPISKRISWGDLLSQTVSNLGSYPLTFLGMIESSTPGVGEIIQSPLPFTHSQTRDIIEIGVLEHSLGFIKYATSFVTWGQDIQGLLTDLTRALGTSINRSGNFYIPNGANLFINKTSGDTFLRGINYSIDKKDPNRSQTSLGEAIYFFTAYRGTPSTVLAYTNQVPTQYYDPNRDGSLVLIPDGYFVPHRIYYAPGFNLTVLQYGQYAYDSLKKAVLSAEKDTFDKVPEVDGLANRTILVVRKDTTKLNNPNDAKFINLGNFGDKVFSNIETYSSFAEPVEVIDSLTYQRQAITFVESNGTVYTDVEEISGGDITYVFGQREFTLDCTTGSGVDGKARVALTAGSFSNPLKNWIYVTRSGEDAILNSSTSEPTGEHAMVGTIMLQSVSDFITYDARGSRRWTQAKEIDGNGLLSYLLRKNRDPNPYRSGLNPTIIFDTVTAPDSIDVTISSGVIREIYDQYPVDLQLSVDTAMVVNDQTTPYTRITNLNEITTDTTGDSLLVNNTYYQLVVAISLNTDGKTQLLINKPNGSYTNAYDAFIDVSGYSVTTFPKDYETIYLVCAIVLRYQTTSGGVYTNAATEFGVDFIDLRGQSLGTGASGAGASAVQQFSDGNFRIFDDGDTTKEIAFEASGITTATTRTLQCPDKSGTLLLEEGISSSNITTKSSDYIILDNDYESTFLVDATGAQRTITLPTAADNTYRKITVKKIDNVNNVVIDGENSETIDGVLTKTLTTQWESITVQCNGTSWFTI